MDEPCAWWARCENTATRERFHPVLGPVSICDRCDKQVARLNGEAT